MWAVLSQFPSKREGDSSLFCGLTRHTFFLRLSMISWGQFYVTERFCSFLKTSQSFDQIQPWLMFLWTTFCPCFSYLFINYVCIFYLLIIWIYYCIPESLNTNISAFWLHNKLCEFTMLEHRFNRYFQWYSAKSHNIC